jgi:aspartate-semialdehyde dehydrogenase
MFERSSTLWKCAVEKINVAVLGATETVGQKFILLLQNHPFFEVKELVASERSAGRSYADACRWKQNTPIPRAVAELKVKSTEELLHSRILFSGLDSSVAGRVETDYANRGHLVISNSSNHRMDPDVPLVIPEINHEHLELIYRQPYKGAIVTNPNCSTIFLAMAIAPLHRDFGVEAVNVTTLQAISGAGYPGVPSLDILGNVVPYIGGEEDKMETEPLKILGALSGDRVEPTSIRISAQCNRVPVYDGHTETLSVKLNTRAGIEEVRQSLKSFSGLPQELKLPTAPERPILLLEEQDRPQPARDVWLERGMATVVGRLRECPVLDVKMTILGHNTIRGAAGAAVLNAETMVEKGYLKNGDRFVKGGTQLRKPTRV